MMMNSIVALAALGVSVTLAGEADKANFNPFEMNAQRTADIKRLQDLTTGTPITTFCSVDNKLKQGAELATCKTDLAKELVNLQLSVQRDFFDAFITQFLVFGQKFDRTKINNFDNLRECNAEVDTFSDFLAAQALADVKKECGVVKVAADKLRTAVRDQLAAEQAKVDNQAGVDAGLLKLDRAHLAFFDRVLNVAQQNQFIDLTEDADRAKQSFEGLLLAQLSATVAEFNKQNYRNYKGVVVAKAELANEVQLLIALAAGEAAKNPLIVDAATRLNALAKTPTPNALVVAGALKLAAARKEKIDTPVALHWRVTDVDAAQEKATVDAFKAAMGPETFALAGVKQANGKLTIDMATGLDQGEIATRDSELGLTCVEKALTCTVVEDVHQPTFDLAQKAAAVVNVGGGGGGGGGGGYGDEPATKPKAVFMNSASSAFVAAGVILASVVLLF